MDRMRINAWMNRASSGDVAAYGELADAVQDELFRLALSLGLRREDAIEVTQETLTRAFACLAAWKPGSDALAWLCGIAVNVVRENKRRRSRDQLWQQQPNPPSPSHPSLEADQLQHLAAALDKLPPRQREAIACRYLRHMSIRETALAMGCAEGTVKSAVAAALKQLHQLLEPQHET